jgi:hypothetical protein
MQLIVHLILVYLQDILSTFVKPTIAFVVIPLTVPVNVGEAKFALNLMHCALDTGLFASLVLSAFVAQISIFYLLLAQLYH